jgi:hypothetical protein
MGGEGVRCGRRRGSNAQRSADARHRVERPTRRASEHGDDRGRGQDVECRMCEPDGDAHAGERIFEGSAVSLPDPLSAPSQASSASVTQTRA